MQLTASSYLAGSQPSDAFSASNAKLSFEDSPVGEALSSSPVDEEMEAWRRLSL